MCNTGRKVLTEAEIIAPFLGLQVNFELVKKNCHANGKGYSDLADCDEFIFYNTEYMDSPEKCALFGVTSALAHNWGYHGTEFSVYIYIKDGTLISAHLLKERYNDYGHFKPELRPCPNPTQQELRIVRRILTFFTTVEETDNG